MTRSEGVRTCRAAASKIKAAEDMRELISTPLAGTAGSTKAKWKKLAGEVATELG